MPISLKSVSFAVVSACVILLLPAVCAARRAPAFLRLIGPGDALLVAGPDGRVIYGKNETNKLTPASTLKILTALAAIDRLGMGYRFKTEFYRDPEGNLKVKGYGDPLLISEEWQEIAQSLAPSLREFKEMIVDDTYFGRDISVPGVGFTTNPYDAPLGALCANFNTVYFKRDDRGRIVSAEPQTPMTPLALEKVRSLGATAGRYTFSPAGSEAARYSGELLAHFLAEKGVQAGGVVRPGAVEGSDTLVYTHNSSFALEQILEKMFEFSNNFIANQVTVALGAAVYGPPGTLAKGVRVISGYARDVLHLPGIDIAEGSGISRLNRLSAADMLVVLKGFEPYRHLLVRKGRILYKSGTLSGVRTRAGYIEGGAGRPYYFVIFMNKSGADIDSMLEYVVKSVEGQQPAGQ